MISYKLSFRNLIFTNLFLHFLDTIKMYKSYAKYFEILIPKLDFETVIPKLVFETLIPKLDFEILIPKLDLKP